jgi:hypothetical protein
MNKIVILVSFLLRSSVVRLLLITRLLLLFWFHLFLYEGLNGNDSATVTQSGTQTMNLIACVTFCLGLEKGMNMQICSLEFGRGRSSGLSHHARGPCRAITGLDPQTPGRSGWVETKKGTSETTP